MLDMDPTTSSGAEHALHTMWTIRRFEEAVEELYSRGALQGTMHLSIGQEAVPTGVCAALVEGDLITSTHRGHGHAIAHGAEPQRMFAELLGRADGYCRGRGGSMHIADVASGNLGANPIVGGSLTIATGAAFAQKRRGTGHVVVCFFGDGASNEGAFHEALNLASLWQVPVVFACENNQYGMSTSVTRSTAGGSIAARAAAYGMPGDEVDGNDVLAVHAAASTAADRARAGDGPTLLELVTYRYKGHSKSDRNLYRTRDEIERWRSERDPIDRFEAHVIEAGLVDQAAVEAVRADVREHIRDSVAAAAKSPHPAPVRDNLEGAVYA